MRLHLSATPIGILILSSAVGSNLVGGGANNTAATSIRLPLAFEPNRGQADAESQFLARGPGFALSLSATHAVFAVRGRQSGAPGTLQMSLLGADSKAKGELLSPMQARTNYLLGNDPKNWRTDVPLFGKVRFREVYPGVDIIYYGNDHQLEYDFEFKPGSDPEKVAWEFDGTDRVWVDERGDLHAWLSGRDVRFHRPVAYQQKGASRRSVTASYTLDNSKVVRLLVGQYDHKAKLVVDPILSFAAALGGGNYEYTDWVGNLLTRDAAGNIYMVGNATTLFPTVTPYQPAMAGVWDVFVAKLSPDGTTLLYSTFLGGSNGDYANGVGVDSAGNMYVAGGTTSTNFPMANSYLGTYPGTPCGFLAKLNSAGNSLLYSTYLGGSNGSTDVRGLAVDPASGAAVVVGATTSNPFPTTPGAFITARPYPSWQDGFAMKFGATGTIVYSTLLGASNDGSAAFAVAIDPTGSAYVAGETNANNYPTTAGAYQQSNAGGADLFLTKLLPNGSNVVFSTLLGGSGYDGARSIALDSSLNVVVGGMTNSPNLPTTQGAFDSSYADGSYAYSGQDGFVARISANGSTLQASTYFGGMKLEELRSVAVDSSGNVIIAGQTQSTDLHLVDPLQTARIGVHTPLFQSGDGGASWTGILPSASGLIPNVTTIQSISASLADPALLYAVGTDCSFYRSFDKGLTWQRGTSLCNSKVVAHPTTASTVYLTTYNGVYASTDSGNNWVPKNTGLPANPNPTALAISPSNPNVMYVTGYGFSGVYKTSNGGLNWASATGNLGSGTPENVYVSPTNDQIAYVMRGGILFQTANGGTTWTQLSRPDCCGVFSPGVSGNSTLYYAAAMFFQKSTDGGLNWTSYPTGVPETPKAIAIVPNTNPAVIYLGYFINGIYKSVDGGISWSSVNGATSFRQDRVRDLAVTANPNSAVLAGFEQMPDGFVAKLNPSMTSAIFSTYFGMYDYDGVRSMVSSGPDVLIYGEATYGDTIPVTPGAYSTPLRGNQDLYVAKLADGTGGCSTTLLLSQTTFDYYGDNARLRVVTNSGCSWSVSGSSPWLNVGPQTSGTGLGLVEFSFSKNTTGATRVGTITINGKTVNVTQFGISPRQDLVIGSSHAGYFIRGQVGKTYSLLVANTGSLNSNGTVTVTDTVPAGLTATSISGSGWNCTQPAGPCTRGESLTSGSVYPALVLTVNVAADAPASVTNVAAVSGGGDFDYSNNTASDPTTINPVGQVPDLTIGKTHTGNFSQSQIGATYTIQVSNAGGGASAGTVTVTDTVPSGLTATAIAGSGWSCTQPSGPCTRSDSLAAGGSYPFLFLTVTVSNSAPASVTNIANVSGGGESNTVNNQASDLTKITAPLQFISVTPCRIMDTRTVGGFGGAFGPPFMSGGATRSIPVPSSSCGIPATAEAYSLNVTVVPRVASLGYLSIWPAGQTQPLVSTLNSPDGSVLANAAIVPAGTGGAINVYATNDTELIIDINGYFTPPEANSLVFYPLTPCRVLDTRNANGTFGGPSLTAGVGRSVPLQSSSCGIPAAAKSYSLNVTAVPNGPLGYLTAWPTGQSQPLVSTLNSLDGSVLANAAIVPAGTGGAISFYASNNMNLVVDINGYFAPAGVGGLNFYTLTPCRVSDTRNTAGSFGGPIFNSGETRSIPVRQSACGLPAAAQAYSLNMTVVPSGFLGYLAVWPAGTPWSGVSTLNSPKGLVTANAALVPAGTSGAVNVLVSNPSHVIMDINGYFGQ